MKWNSLAGRGKNDRDLYSHACEREDARKFLQGLTWTKRAPREKHAAYLKPSAAPLSSLALRLGSAGCNEQSEGREN